MFFLKEYCFWLVKLFLLNINWESNLVEVDFMKKFVNNLNYRYCKGFCRGVTTVAQPSCNRHTTITQPLLQPLRNHHATVRGNNDR